MLTATARRPGSPGVRLTLLAVLAVAWGVTGLLGPSPRAAAAGSLGTPTWSVSQSGTGTTGTTYTYTFTAATTATLTSVTMTVPAVTGGTPAVAMTGVSPVSLRGGTIGLASSTLTYAVSAGVSIAAGTAVSVKVTGLTNTSAQNTYTSTITTKSSAGTVDTGTTGSVTMTTSTLGTPAWSASVTTVGAASTYTFTFNAGLLGGLLLTSATMTVPPGTTGTPALGAVSPAGLGGGSISRSGTTLTYTAPALGVSLLGAVSIQVTGLSNTPVAGSYTSEIVATGTVVLVPLTASGITPAVSITGRLNLSAPGSLGWTAVLTGVSQSTADPTAGDQQLTVDDETSTGNGWHVQVSATTFTTGSASLPNTGTFTFTSTAGVTSATGPSAACVVSCTPPVNSTTYPVAITTAASSPTPVSVFSTPANTGLGPVTIGGSPSPIGWWITIPAAARAGTYTSTITVQITSGP